METLARKTLGKQVKGNLYFHMTAIEDLDPCVREQARFAAARADLDTETGFNVIKIDEAGNQISLLYQGSKSRGISLVVARYILKRAREHYTEWSAREKE